MPRTIVLWDIDNTLLYTGGAGSLGMTRAFRDLHGIDDAFGRIEFSGRTDTAIFRDCARDHGIAEAALDAEQQRFLDAYLPHLEAALHEVEGRLMPGIADALDALAAADAVVQGLGTGNFRDGGALKLRHYGIDHHFPGTIGGFGEDSPSRDEVIGHAIRRLSSGGEAGRVVVIGDTPHDVTAARANGAFALAVATGRNPAAELLACGADVALDDLSDTARVLEIVLGLGGTTDSTGSRR
jgi:phosphoglycolate phosphatase-like HAD superfamily hydrolase